MVNRELDLLIASLHSLFLESNVVLDGSLCILLASWLGPRLFLNVAFISSNTRS